MWLNRINPQLNTIWCGQWPVGFVEAARRIYDHELVLFAAGECRVQLEQREYRCTPGTFMIVPPGVIHATTAISREKVMRYCFHFDWVYSPRASALPVCVYLPAQLKKNGVRAAPAWIGSRRWHGPIGSQATAIKLAEEINACWRHPDRVARATGRALLLELLVRLLSAPPQRPTLPNRQGALAERVKQLLDNRYTARDSIQALLEQTGFSYAHLCRIFKKQYGIAPLGYVTAGRIARAKALLREGNSSIKKVAAAAGFEDAAYFSRLFRKVTGLSPALFAAQSLLG